MRRFPAIELRDIAYAFAHSRKWRVAIAALSTGTALLITGATLKVFDEPVVLMFSAAVVITALLAGFQAGCLATALSLVCIRYVLPPARESFIAAGAHETLRVVLFAITGLLLSWIVGQTAQIGRRLHIELHDKTRLVAEVSELASIVESSNDAIFSKKLDGTITSWNHAAEEMYGYRAEEAIGRNVGMLIPEEYAEEEERILRLVGSGRKTPRYDTVRRRKDGGQIRVSLVLSPVHDEHDRVVGASSIARDITLEKQQEAMLIASEKAAAMGRMAGSMAHEINNPLAAISNLVLLLSKKKQEDFEARHYMSMLAEEVERVVHITRQTLGFYQESRTPVPLDLSTAVNDVVGLYAKEISAKEITVEKRFSAVSEVEAYPAEVRHLLSNLVMNSMEAVARRGKITIQIGEAAEAPEKVAITIADNGPGIPSGIAEKVFEPFFSTKGEKGTGLGLWVSRGIVARHGGELRFSSTSEGAEHGTTFTVVLPKNFSQQDAGAKRGAA